MFNNEEEILKTFLVLLAFIATFTVQASKLDNQLQQHASPYLAMHGNDPIAWQEWNKKTVSRAKKEGKLIFVSSGYFSCHWCHVMQRESFKSIDVAKILNSHFIPVKVDREINAALDSRLIDFVERTQGQAGWPLNVFITPGGYPLVGMTYVPKNNFISILEKITKRWKEEKKQLNDIAVSASDELATAELFPTDKIAAGIGQEYINRFISQAKTMSDDMAGGFGQQNKFPSVPQLTTLLTAYENKPDEELKDFILLTLTKMATQGLNDQLGGGFFRYTVDPNWQVPHFEKMLYDNALLASLYIDAARIFSVKQFDTIARQTLDFLITTFRSEQGAYIASLSAVDDKNVEGGYYLWQLEELKKVLHKDEMALLEVIWQLQGPDDLDGGQHLVEAMTLDEAAKLLKISNSKAEKYFTSAKRKMLEVRNTRHVPRDDKLLAAWNGLTLSAFAKAAKQYNSERYANAAKNIKNYIYNNLWQKNKLLRAVKGDKVLGEGELEDYAYVAQALTDWLEYSENKTDRQWLNDIISQGWTRFYSKQGWLLTENSLLKYREGEAVIADGVLPSASSLLIDVSLKHANKTKDTRLKKKSLAALNVGHLDIVSEPFWYSSQINGLLVYQNSIK